MFGLLNLNKPAGLTSRAVVNQVQRLIRPEKVGHAGTLDPLATGVLVLAVGPATRLMQYVQRQSKQYVGTFLLGRVSNTEDVEGEVTLLPDAHRPTREEILAQLPAFIGQIEQRPPAFSALKVAGRRAYDLARAGEPVELAPRPITIYDIELVEYHYPKLVLNITCGAGTYIRSLGRDLAAALGAGAVMSALVRTRIGPFSLPQSISPEELTQENLAGYLQPARLALVGLPEVTLDEAEIEEVRNGRFLPERSSPPPEGAEVVALDAQGALIAILTPRAEGRLRASRNFAHLR